jgi:hypothetical protein
MCTFDQQADMQRLIQFLARLELPEEISEECDPILVAIDDADRLYSMIKDAREILRSRAHGKS